MARFDKIDESVGWGNVTDEIERDAIESESSVYLSFFVRSLMTFQTGILSFLRSL
jgi:hypothetical protein